MSVFINNKEDFIMIALEAFLYVVFFAAMFLIYWKFSKKESPNKEHNKPKANS